MESLWARPLPRSASFRFFRICAQVLRPSTRRHESSYRRSRSRLNIKPDASFFPSKTDLHDHIVFNPPPSTPNVYHTPTIFLPKEDQRRLLQASLATNASQISSAAAMTSITRERIPPPVRKPYEKRYHLTEKDMEEMRSLRTADPVKWSASQLAKKFDCSTYFVGIVTEGIAKSKQEQQKQVTQIVKSRWGVKRRVAREDRAIRKERWYRDA